MAINIGDTGSLVEELQQDLVENGFSCGADVAGTPRSFGTDTRDAVKLFQASHVGPDGVPLVVDGVVGPRTWWALEHSSGDSQGSGLLPGMPSQAASNRVAASALDSALGELRRGVVEIPDGSNRGPRVDEYTGMGGQLSSVVGPPWCAYFASWNFAKAPGGAPFGRIGGAQEIVRYCQAHVPGSVFDSWGAGVGVGEASTRVRPGDLGVIPTGDVHGHVLQVVASSGGRIWTVEGNSGNAVRSRERSVSAVRWFVNFDQYALARGL